MERIEDDTVLLVLTLCPPYHRSTAASVCRRLRFVAANPSLWRRLDAAHIHVQFSFSPQIPIIFLPSIRFLSLYVRSGEVCQWRLLRAPKLLPGICPQLTTLILRRCPDVDNTGLESILKKAPALQALDLRGCTGIRLQQRAGGAGWALAVPSTLRQLWLGWDSGWR